MNAPIDPQGDMVQIHVYLPSDLKRRLREYAGVRGLSSGEVVRALLREKLEGKEK